MRFSWIVPFFILFFSASLLLFNLDFYEEQVEGYGGYEDEVTGLLNGFRGGDLDLSPYSEREAMHLDDVYSLVIALVIITTMLGFGLFMAIALSDRQDTRQSFIYGGIYGVILTLVVTLTFLSFERVFELFHILLFSNDLWRLPMDALLIQMFPLSFFVHALAYIVLYMLIFSFLFIALGLYIPGGTNDGTEQKT